MEQVAHTADRTTAAVLGPRLAADIVSMTRRVGVRLDYSPDSLALVDRGCQERRDGGYRLTLEGIHG